ncbi:probable serine/threonine-protein kinase mos at C-terminar half [Coccomyxa sp. Obi]|nr:probable serine/threonine-protein kinase mos at C-terminar half [Coccomyxa sp. Obi]
MSNTRVTGGTERRHGGPKSSSMEKVLKRKLLDDTPNQDSVANRVAKRARGAAASRRQFTPATPPPATPSQQSCEAPTLRMGRSHPASARDISRMQALRQQAATEKLRREAAEAKARALQDQLTILTRQKSNLESQLSSKVREVQQLQQRLDERKAASSQDSPASDQTAGKTFTRQEADNEQVKQLKLQLQFNQVASADWKKAAEHATKDGAMWKAQAVQWKEQAEINLLKTHKAVTSLELPEFPEEAVTILGNLGNGGCATVHVAELKCKVALKRASNEKGRKELAAQTQRTEEALLALMRHPHIIKGLGKVKEPGQDIHSLLLEVGRTDLFAVINLYCKKRQQMPAELQLAIAEHCALGLRYMHARGYCHSDVKPSNILLFGSDTEGIRAKVADLGMAALCHPTTGRVIPGQLVAGTDPFRRPDAMMDESVAGFHGDFYAYGMCLWMMLAREDPQTRLMDTLRAKVDGAWFQNCAQYQESKWRGAATAERHCTLAYCDSVVRLRLQVPEEKAASMPRKYVDLINSLLDPRDDPATGGPGIPWDHILTTISECRAELARPAGNTSV